MLGRPKRSVSLAGKRRAKERGKDVNKACKKPKKPKNLALDRDEENPKSESELAETPLDSFDAFLESQQTGSSAEDPPEESQQPKEITSPKREAELPKHLQVLQDYDSFINDNSPADSQNGPQWVHVHGLAIPPVATVDKHAKVHLHNLRILVGGSGHTFFVRASGKVVVRRQVNSPRMGNSKASRPVHKDAAEIKSLQFEPSEEVWILSDCGLLVSKQRLLFLGMRRWDLISQIGALTSVVFMNTGLMCFRLGVSPPGLLWAQPLDWEKRPAGDPCMLFLDLSGDRLLSLDLSINVAFKSIRQTYDNLRSFAMAGSCREMCVEVQ
jgi:hypothetical protein